MIIQIPEIEAYAGTPEKVEPQRGYLGEIGVGLVFRHIEIEVRVRFELSANTIRTAKIAEMPAAVLQQGKVGVSDLLDIGEATHVCVWQDAGTGPRTADTVYPMIAEQLVETAGTK